MSRVVKVSKLSPFEQPARLSVLSYNLLAPLFVRPVDRRTGQIQDFAAFLWAEPADEVLNWEKRRPKIIQELLTARADVICLQEVQFDAPRPGCTDFELPEFLRLEGYDWQLPSNQSLTEMADRNKRVLGTEAAVGNAVLWRRDRLVAVDCGADLKQHNTRVSVALKGLSGSALDTLGLTLVSSLHLDAKDELKRAKTLFQVVSAAQDIGAPRSVIAGDMNAEFVPGSMVTAFDMTQTAAPSAEEVVAACASALRVEQPSEEELTEWRTGLRDVHDQLSEARVELARAPTGLTRSAWDHDKDCGPCVGWRLDHILFTSATLSLASLWETLEADERAMTAGLPCISCPSDHLPIAASFDLVDVAAPDTAMVADVTGRVDALVDKQKAELTRFVDAGPVSAAGGKGKRKPSPEEIAALRARRQQEKELMATLEDERRAFLSEMGRDQLRVADAHLVHRALAGLKRAKTKMSFGLSPSPTSVWREMGPKLFD